MAEIILDIYGFDIEGSSLYFNCQYINAIFHMDIETGKTDCIKVPERYSMNIGSLHYALRIVEDKIWFAPYGADEIMVYDLKSGACEYIGIPRLEGHGRKHVKFCDIYEYGGWLILVPAEYPAILKIDKASYKITVVKWEEELIERYPHFKEDGRYIGISSWNYEVLGNMLHLFASNVSIRYNMDSDELDFCEISNERKSYAGVAGYGDKFALADRYDCELAIWDAAENKILKTIDLEYKGLNAEDDGGPLWVYKVKGGIAIAQGRDDFLRFFDYEGESRKIDLYIGRKDKYGCFINRVRQKGSRLAIPLEGQNAVLIVDTQEWEAKRVRMEICGLDMLKTRVEKEEYIVESNSPFRGLSDLIGRLKKSEGSKNTIAGGGGIGNKIYQSLRL